MTHPTEPDLSSLYRIKIRGRLKESWSDWFDGMTIEFAIGADEKPITTLTGVIADQSALYGVLNRVRQLRELTTDLQALAGGKGGTLARLSQLGFPVPDGFVILPAAFEGDKLTPESWIQVREQLNRLRKEYPGASFAVRSSALAEPRRFNVSGFFNRQC